MKAERASVELDRRADARPLRQIIDSIRATDPAVAPTIAEFRLLCALAEHDTAGAENALMALGEGPVRLVRANNVVFPRPFIEGLIARMVKDDDKARAAFTAARAEQEKAIKAQPNYGPALCVLGLIDAALGRKEEHCAKAGARSSFFPRRKTHFRVRSC